MNYDEFKRIILSQDKSFVQHKIGYKMLISALDSFYTSEEL